MSLENFDMKTDEEVKKLEKLKNENLKLIYYHHEKGALEKLLENNILLMETFKKIKNEIKYIFGFDYGEFRRIETSINDFEMKGIEGKPYYYFEDEFIYLVEKNEEYFLIKYKSVLNLYTREKEKEKGSLLLEKISFYRQYEEERNKNCEIVKLNEEYRDVMLEFIEKTMVSDRLGVFNLFVEKTLKEGEKINVDDFLGLPEKNNLYACKLFMEFLPQSENNNPYKYFEKEYYLKEKNKAPQIEKYFNKEKNKIIFKEGCTLFKMDLKTMDIEMLI